MLRPLIFRNFFSKIFRKTKWAALLIRPKLRFVHLPPQGEGYHHCHKKTLIPSALQKRAIKTATPGARQKQITKTLRPSALQKQAVQGKRGFCAASLLYVNEQAKTQARHSNATLFKRAFTNIEIRHKKADQSLHTNLRSACTPPRARVRRRRTYRQAYSRRHTFSNAAKFYTDRSSLP